MLYRYGNPAAYGGSGSQILYNQHDAKWLDDGNILVFDNGNPKERPYSRVVELNLPDYGSSSSTQALSSTIVWQYPSNTSDASVAFFSDHISGAQRLESGNTLICSGTEGRFFEVTPAGDIIWEYVNPFISTGPNGKESNDVFRAEAYPADFIGQALGDTSSLAQDVPQNIVLGEQQEIGGTPVSGPPGIISISPESIAAGANNVVLIIQLAPSFAPPEQVQFTRIAIADVEATSWTRSGDTISALFDIPAQLSAETYTLSVTFPGRNSEVIVFTHSIDIR